MTAPMRMTPPATPVPADSLPGRLHIALRELRRCRDDDDMRSITHRIERLSDREVRNALALAVVTEAWTDEERTNAVTFPPEDGDPKRSPAYRKFIRGFKAWERQQAGPVVEPTVEMGDAA